MRGGRARGVQSGSGGADRLTERGCDARRCRLAHVLLPGAKSYQIRGYAARMPQPQQVARYTRRIGADLERVWENVRDWAHLPWLHRASFRAIALEEEGSWGWRARIGLADAREIRLELVIDGLRYVSRTLEGEGAGTEIWTALQARDASTDIEVEFHVPGVSAAAAPKLGALYTALYTRLWDEDEAMMRRRGALLARGAAGHALLPPDAAPLDLGPEAEVRRRAPFGIEFAGRAFHVGAAGRRAGRVVGGMPALARSAPGRPRRAGRRHLPVARLPLRAALRTRLRRRRAPAAVAGSAHRRRRGRARARVCLISCWSRGRPTRSTRAA